MPRVKRNNNVAIKPQVEVEKIICGMCGIEKKVADFYTSYNPIHKTGRLSYCKECLKNMCKDDKGNIIIEKVKDMLKMIDRPFLYDIFDISVKLYAESENSKRKTRDIIGDYFKNISMPQYRDLKWNDSTFAKNDNIINENNKAEIIYFNKDDEKKYSVQWMGEYTPLDLEYLDKYLHGLHGDFKIITENHKDYAKKIAKASLHMDKCFQDMLNGVQGADKRYKDARETFDTLSKSAQFSENTRGQNDVSLGGFGVVFDRVEQKTWIPKHVPLEKDVIDNIIESFGIINKSL